MKRNVQYDVERERKEGNQERSRIPSFPNFPEDNFYPRCTIQNDLFLNLIIRC